MAHSTNGPLLGGGTFLLVECAMHYKPYCNSELYSELPWRLVRLSRLRRRSRATPTLVFSSGLDRASEPRHQIGGDTNDDGEQRTSGEHEWYRQPLDHQHTWIVNGNVCRNPVPVSDGCNGLN